MGVKLPGQSVVLPKDRMMMLEVAGQQADKMKAKAGAAKPTGGAASDSQEVAVQKALNQAMARMNENKDN